MTTGISLVRENTASMQPPRALWVSFPLGRPLGVPGDAAFQHRVIDAALALLDRPEGPVLEDYPEDAPAVELEAVAACPISFARRDDGADTWEARLTAELATLRPWHDVARRRRRGRTLVGASQHSPEDNVAALGRALDAQERPKDIKWLKHAIEDLKTLYLEAMTAQPGQHDAPAVERRFWKETRLGEALLHLYDAFQEDPDPRQQLVARMIAPREAVGGSTGPAAGVVTGLPEGD